MEGGATFQHSPCCSPHRAAAVRPSRDGETRVYLGSGLGDKVPAIRSALEGGDVLTVAAVPEYVEAGIVLGFHLPKSEARGRDSPPTAHKKFSGSLLKCRKKSARVTRPIGFGMASRTLRCRRAGA